MRVFGVRWQAQGDTAFNDPLPLDGKSGVALRLPPHSKKSWRTILVHFCFRCTLLLFLLLRAAAGFSAEPFDRTKLEKMDAEIEQAIAEGKLPGGVLWLEHKGNR